jgi:hypothetical protein
MMQEKTCTKCGEKKLIDLFYKRSDQVGKYASHCKACKRAKDNAHASKPEIKALRAEYAKKRRADPVSRQKDHQTKAIYHRTDEYRAKKREEGRIRRSDPKEVERQRAYDLKRAKENPAYFSQKTRYRKAKKLQRTPSWLNSGHWFEMESIYKYCAALRSIGFDYEVDHIVPLQGKNVSGLHVPWNLQLLTASENASKGNRF